MSQESPGRPDIDPDGELAQAIHDAGGAPAAEAELCRRLFPRVRAYGARHLGDRDAAIDLAQQVLMLTVTKLRRRQIDEPRRIASFVLGAARLTAKSMQRADRRWPASADLAAAEALAVDPPEPVDTERLRECLAGLAERERTVVLLTFYDLRTSRQVGHQLGVSEGNVRVIRSRALGRLRDCMDAGVGGERR